MRTCTGYCGAACPPWPRPWPSSRAAPHPARPRSPAAPSTGRYGTWSSGTSAASTSSLGTSKVRGASPAPGFRWGVGKRRATSRESATCAREICPISPLVTEGPSANLAPLHPAPVTKPLGPRWHRPAAQGFSPSFCSPAFCPLIPPTLPVRAPAPAPSTWTPTPPPRPGSWSPLPIPARASALQARGLTTPVGGPFGAGGLHPGGRKAAEGDLQLRRKATRG